MLNFEKQSSQENPEEDRFSPLKQQMERLKLISPPPKLALCSPIKLTKMKKTKQINTQYLRVFDQGDFEYNQLLGKGSFGYVKKCSLKNEDIDQDEDEKYMAAKFMSKEQFIN